MDAKELIRIKEEISKDVLYDDKLVGVGISKNKVIVFTKDVNISLSTFYDNVSLAKANFVSHTISGILRHKFRPLIAGVSVGSLNGLTGTIGYIYNGYIISASHVLSSNPVGSNGYDFVTQPGPADGGTKEDIVGKTVYYKVLRNGVEGDFAIAKADVKYDNIVYGIGNVNKFTNIKPGLKVVKVGRTTGMTMGIIFTVNTDAKVLYPELNKEVMLKNQFVVYGKRFSQPGDSGSSVIFNDKVAGFVVAGDDVNTLCTPSYVVFKNFGKITKTSYGVINTWR